MADLQIRPLSEDHAFGARVVGVTHDNVEDADVQRQLNALFEDRGVLVFEEMESSSEMQLAVSAVFGPPQDYAIKDYSGKSGEHKGVISLGAQADKATVVELDGKKIAGLLAWHFDACYVPKLNRAGVLRVITSPPEGGMTGFVDGVQLYADLPDEWRQRAEALSVVYYQYNMLDKQRFGMPEGIRFLQLQQEAEELFEISKDIPRAVHPAVWQRGTGEKVLHVSPWQADGLAGFDASEGDALLEDLIQQMYAVMKPYWHPWKPTDMVIWDNWRFLHGSSGYEPGHARDPQRTTIAGDYGLGCLLEDWQARESATA